VVTTFSSNYTATLLKKQQSKKRKAMPLIRQETSTHIKIKNKNKTKKAKG